MNKIVGIPSEGTELTDNISPHFGHCKYFFVVEISARNNSQKILILPNEGHTACMEPVLNMKKRNVTDMILTGTGMRPFMGFQQFNINLFQGVNASIEKNIELLIQGKLHAMFNASCGNHSNHAHTL